MLSRFRTILDRSFTIDGYLRSVPDYLPSRLEHRPHHSHRPHFFDHTTRRWEKWLAGVTPKYQVLSARASADIFEPLISSPPSHDCVIEAHSAFTLGRHFRFGRFRRITWTHWTTSTLLPSLLHHQTLRISNLDICDSCNCDFAITLAAQTNEVFASNHVPCHHQDAPYHYAFTTESLP